MLIEKNSIEEINIGAHFTEIIIVVNPQNTTRKWYMSQKSIIDVYKKPVKVIQINP